MPNPAGGQITPLDCASLSLKGPELEPSPTVGGSPLASGGHATPGSGATRPWGADCASAELAIVTPPIIEMSKSLIGLHAGTHFDHAACSYSVAQAHHAFYLGAMLAAEEGAFLFESVTDNMNAAIPAGRGQRMDCTLEAVECVGCTIHGHFERLVVVVSARFAFSHDGLSLGLEKGVHRTTRVGPRRFRKASTPKSAATPRRNRANGWLELA